MKEIIILRLSSLGDIVMTSPVFEELKRLYPKARISFITSSQYQGLMEDNPYIDKIFYIETRTKHNKRKGLNTFINEFELNRINFDLLIDLHWNFRTVYLSKKLNAKKKVTWKSQALKRNIYVLFHLPLRIQPVTKRYLGTIKGYINNDNISNSYKYFFNTNLAQELKVRIPGLASAGLIFPASKWPTKMYPKEYFIELINRLDNKFFLLGTKDEYEVCQFISEKTGVPNLAGKLSIKETAAAIGISRFVIANDSGPMHISSGIGKPTVALFGCTTTQLGFAPNQNNSLIIEDSELQCRPCSLHGWGKCPKGHFKCMLNLNPEKVAAKIKNWLVNHE